MYPLATRGSTPPLVRERSIATPTSDHNSALGAAAGANVTGNWNIDIENEGGSGESNTIRIGEPAKPVGPNTMVEQLRTFIAGIRGVTTGNANAVPVVIDSDGQPGTVSSSRRFKDEIRPMNKASETILGLKPVTFHYKSDSTGTPQFGLIAEEVAKVNSDLVVRGDDGEIYTVRYEAVNAMLLNEFLKEHRKVERQEATIAELKSMVAQQQKGMEVLTATVKEQAAQIQKVSAQLEVNRSAPQIVDNHQ